jgi:hypothetical protein
MLANFLGVLPILTPPLCALAFIMCSKSNPLVVFALDRTDFLYCLSVRPALGQRFYLLWGHYASKYWLNLDISESLRNLKAYRLEKNGW